VLVARPGDMEPGMSFDLSRRPDGTLQGRFSMPAEAVEDQPLEAVYEDGEVVSLLYRDPQGTLSLFRGARAGDASTIRGEMKEGASTYPFWIRRKAAGPDPAAPRGGELRPLATDLAQLKERFNQDLGKLRLLLIVSPTCSTCQMTAEIVGRQLAASAADRDLRVYVVWAKILDHDSREAAQRALRFIGGPGVTSFYAAGPSLAEAFKSQLGLKKSAAWDVVLLFSRGARWDDGVPRAAFFMHRLEELPAASKFNGPELAAEVERQLAIPPPAR